VEQQGALELVLGPPAVQGAISDPDLRQHQGIFL
jgi:hypothetical protein